MIKTLLEIYQRLECLLSHQMVLYSHPSFDWIDPCYHSLHLPNLFHLSLQLFMLEKFFCLWLYPIKFHFEPHFPLQLLSLLS